MKESKIYSRSFDIEDASLAFVFYKGMGQREDVSSCIIYTNEIQNRIKVEWTYYEE